MKTARTALMCATAAAFGAAVLAQEDAIAFALGLAPLAWIALEACWRLFDR